MLDIDQYQQEILIPLIAGMAGFGNEAITTMTMIAAHESRGGTFVVQQESRIAKGLYQMEDFTHDSIWRNSDNIWSDATKLGIITKGQLAKNIQPSAERLIYDMRYATFMARKYLHMDKRPLPKGLESTAEYCCNYWNAGGKATPEKYLNDYLTWSGL